MKGTYRTYRFQVIPKLTYTRNEFDVLVVDTEEYRYRVADVYNTIVYDSELRAVPENVATFEEAVNAAIAFINVRVSLGETDPTMDALPAII